MLKHPCIFSASLLVIIQHKCFPYILISLVVSHSQILSFQELQVTGIPGISFHYLALIWAIPFHKEFSHNYCFIWSSSKDTVGSLPMSKVRHVSPDSPKSCEKPFWEWYFWLQRDEVDSSSAAAVMLVGSFGEVATGEESPLAAWLWDSRFRWKRRPAAICYNSMSWASSSLKSLMLDSLDELTSAGSRRLRRASSEAYLRT